MDGLYMWIGIHVIMICTLVVLCLCLYNKQISDRNNCIYNQNILIENLTEKAKLAGIDPLTGLMNRRGFEPLFRNSLNLLSKGKGEKRADVGTGLGLMIIDADNFKSINDNHGHSFGDIVLKSIATSLEETLRKTDVICRYGGEEFIAVLPNVTADTAREISENVRLAVAKLLFADEAVVTVSIGVSYTHDQMDGMELINQADTALYKAKSEGKNRVVVYQEEEDSIVDK